MAKNAVKNNLNLNKKAHKKSVYCGVGGQAVLEGIMMKKDDDYCVAVRLPSGGISLNKDSYQGIGKGKKFTKLPFIRGCFAFIDSLVLGMKCLDMSARLAGDDEKIAPTKADKVLDKITGGRTDSFLSAFAVVFSVILAMGLFFILPYFASRFIAKFVHYNSVILIAEGVIRLAIFLIYVVSISAMKEIKRVYQYHGAEHKCINCIEHGLPLETENVRKCSRLHRRCGTSFILFVMVISIIVFFFIRADSPLLRLGLRLVLIPLIASISYEIIKLAGRFDNPFMNILSAPGLLLQKITTREPDANMINVAISAVESVFDWRDFLVKNHGYQYDDGDNNMEADLSNSAPAFSGGA